MPKYIPIIGMEVHVELNTASKMFCSCHNDSDEAEPNTHICEICTAQPGTLPVPNKQALIDTVKIGTALGCTIRDLSKFDRKHYFYPDLPKGYQISQYDEPIAEHGQITLDLSLEETERNEAVIGITRAHLEEDTAKLLHSTDGSTLVDFNRAGTPLVEIVTDPDFQSGIEAKIYCQELRMLMRALRVSDADMEKGHMRCEANISVQEAGRFEIVDGKVRPLGDYVLNAKVELKNLNSFKAVERGIAYEIARQLACIEAGETWIQQTRGWNEDKGETYLQRKKENAEDYRYFPDPDIPPFHPRALAGHVTLPELPQAKRARFVSEYGLSLADARLLSEDSAWANFTEAVMSELFEWLHALPEVSGSTADILDEQRNKIVRLAGGWLTSKLLGVLNEKQMTISDIHCSPENFAELIALLYTERINATNAHKVLLIMVGLDTDKDPTHIMEEKGWGQMSDETELQQVVDRIITEHPDQVAQFKSGKDTIIKYLIGMCMKATEGSADPVVIERLLRSSLS
jgi:aspartyl-tRNA(Asn)/glutamyl-tRNA(Gln) amidotransferase subunit B